MRFAAVPIGAAVALGLCAGAAAAATFVGGSVSEAEFGYENVDAAVGGQAFIAHHFPGSPLWLELAYLATGDAEVEQRG